MIIASAIKTPDGDVFVGKRHGDCFKNARTIMKMEKPDERTFKASQGFINTNLEFLDREQAYYEAFECGQCEEQIPPNQKKISLMKSCGLNVVWKPQLASEDLW